MQCTTIRRIGKLIDILRSYAFNFAFESFPPQSLLVKLLRTTIYVAMSFRRGSGMFLPAAKPAGQWMTIGLL